MRLSIFLYAGSSTMGRKLVMGPAGLFGSCRSSREPVPRSSGFGSSNMMLNICAISVFVDGVHAFRVSALILSGPAARLLLSF